MVCAENSSFKYLTPVGCMVSQTLGRDQSGQGAVRDVLLAGRRLERSAGLQLLAARGGYLEPLALLSSHHGINSSTFIIRTKESSCIVLPFHGLSWVVWFGYVVGKPGIHRNYIGGSSYTICLELIWS